jgi:dTDP-4-amino-4,6-dideoxygalactose transaminase
MKSIWETVSFFEEEIANYCGSKYAVATDSCTNSIFLCLKYLDNPIDVIIPTKTYISVPMSVKHANYGLKFENIEWEGSYQLGNTQIIDSACRFEEGMYLDGTFCCLSFHFKKIIPIGRGGMILTNDKDAADWLRMARYDGRPTYSYNDILKTGISVMGYHMYMTPEQASRGIEQFYRAKSEGKKVCGSSSEFMVDLSKLDIFKT